MARNVETTIAALLAKAEGTTNAHEAETFMAKAEAMMLQHGIERANLQAKTPGTRQEEIVIDKVYIKNGHGYAAAMAAIGHAIGPSFSLRTLQANLSDGSKMVWLIGHASDVEQARTLMNSLTEQSRKQALAWWRKEGKASYFAPTDNDAYLARREFIYAFASGVRDRLEETRNRVVAEASAGTDLVLVDRSKRVENWVDENLKTSKGRASRRNHGGFAATQAGFASGRDSVNSKAIS